MRMRVFLCFLHAFSSEPVGSTPLSLAIKPAALEEVIDDHVDECMASLDIPFSEPTSA